ncbi:unnamed protein product [Protopolystoma xenopodis]|uniref:Uncharacterized protein n=1 Tax=Protopolystoma xenopodis TaxID=117903 RepID=A0A3S5AVP9_9PLAT|nr:unnamed protein product [Protopolystoma xenopodis]
MHRRSASPSVSSLFPSPTSGNVLERGHLFAGEQTTMARPPTESLKEHNTGIRRKSSPSILKRLSGSPSGIGLGFGGSRKKKKKQQQLQSELSQNQLIIQQAPQRPTQTTQEASPRAQPLIGQTLSLTGLQTHIRSGTPHTITVGAKTTTGTFSSLITVPINVTDTGVEELAFGANKEECNIKQARQNISSGKVKAATALGFSILSARGRLISVASTPSVHLAVIQDKESGSTQPGVKMRRVS